MFNVVDCLRKEMDCFTFESSPCVVTERLLVADVYDLLLRRFRNYDDFVKIDECKLPFGSFEDHVHCALKTSRCVPESEQHSKNWKSS